MKENVSFIIIIIIEYAVYVWLWLNKQDFEYASGPKYAKILNMAVFSICERYAAFWIDQNMPW